MGCFARVEAIMGWTGFASGDMPAVLCGRRAILGPGNDPFEVVPRCDVPTCHSGLSNWQNNKQFHMGIKSEAASSGAIPNELIINRNQAHLPFFCRR